MGYDVEEHPEPGYIEVKIITAKRIGVMIRVSYDSMYRSDVVDSIVARMNESIRIGI